MKELPILMSTPMVQANLADLKTETRRTRGLEHLNVNPLATPDAWEFIGILLGSYKDKCESVFRFIHKPSGGPINICCPYGQVGDLLYVREIFQYRDNNKARIVYRADIDDITADIVKWKPSIHMPKAAARIWLQIKSIGVERLHDITGPAAAAEGIRIPMNDGKVLFKAEANSAIEFLTRPSLKSEPYTTDELLIAHYAELWCELNGRESWDANPWVWVIKYKVLSKTGKPDFVRHPELVSGS